MTLENNRISCCCSTDDTSCKMLMNSPAKGDYQYKPTMLEHLANCTTHGVLIIPTVYAVINMLDIASTPRQKANAFLFGAALLSVFIISTTFHIASWYGQRKTLRFLLHFGDRAVIYFFIAASYTPWLTLKKVGPIGQSMFWLVWLLAILGIFYSYFYYEKYKRLEIALYLCIGIGPSIAVIDVQSSHDGVYELALGGLIYVLGVVFFKSDGVIPCAHAIWHVFVVAGAAIHFYAIQTYLMGGINELDS